MGGPNAGPRAADRAGPRVRKTASGTSFADALVAGPAAGAAGGVPLLADPAGTSLAAHRDAVGSVTVGGGEAVVGQAAFEAARDALG